MIKISKAKWERRSDAGKFGSNGHYYYVLCAKLENRASAELAGVGWCDGCIKGGWQIEQIGYTVALKDGWHNIDNRHYATAVEAMLNAEKILRQVLKRL
jgi:hypothetical protein